MLATLGVEHRQNVLPRLRDAKATRYVPNAKLASRGWSKTSELIRDPKRRTYSLPEPPD